MILGDGPSITIYHNDLTNDIIKATNQNDKTFIVDKDGKLGINTKPLWRCKNRCKWFWTSNSK